MTDYSFIYIGTSGSERGVFCCFGQILFLPKIRFWAKNQFYRFFKTKVRFLNENNVFYKSLDECVLPTNVGCHKHQWSSGRMPAFQTRDPGSILTWCNVFLILSQKYMVRVFSMVRRCRARARFATVPSAPPLRSPRAREVGRCATSAQNY